MYGTAEELATVDAFVPTYANTAINPHKLIITKVLKVPPLPGREAHYPVTALENAAREACRTTYVGILDIDLEVFPGGPGEPAGLLKVAVVQVEPSPG